MPLIAADPDNEITSEPPNTEPQERERASNGAICSQLNHLNGPNLPSALNKVRLNCAMLDNLDTHTDQCDHTGRAGQTVWSEYERFLLACGAHHQVVGLQPLKTKR